MKKQVVVIIGSGPAGLACAHAASGLGFYPTVFSDTGDPTPQRGPLLVQRPIPGINRAHPDGYIRQVVWGGSILDYRYKLYGDINININGDVLQKGYHAWEMQRTYDEMWRIYGDRVTKAKVDPDILMGMAGGSDHLVINTAPMPQFCLTPNIHSFSSKPVAVTDYAQEGVPDNTIVFNAGDGDWVRSSRIFGHESTEYKVEDRPDGARIIRKPLGTNCTCHPRVLRTGRFGSWHNETWVDTAYYDTREALL